MDEPRSAPFDDDEDEDEDEDDDIYLNSVARLKVLKMRGLQGMEKRQEPEVAVKPEAVAEPEVPAEPEAAIVPEARPAPSINPPSWPSSGPCTRSESRRRRAASQSARRGRRRNQPAPADDSELRIVSVDSVPDCASAAYEGAKQIVTIDDSHESGDEENYDVTVNVLWRSKTVHRLTIKRNQNFRKIFEHFARLEGVAIEDVLITRKETPIKRTETPASIGFRIIDILEGGIVESANPAAEPECCQIRVQLAERDSISVPVPRDATFEALFRACAEKMAVPVARVKLYFDGEPVAATDTPESLDIEDEACFDLRVIMAPVKPSRRP